MMGNWKGTAADGKTYQVSCYNLDAIISVGYRVKSPRGVPFRIWATSVLKEYIRKGFALDDDRLKELGGGGYFKELLERIRDIRHSAWRKGQAIFRNVREYRLSCENQGAGDAGTMPTVSFRRLTKFDPTRNVTKLVVEKYTQ
jgi:hypothetical protein